MYIRRKREDRLEFGNWLEDKIDVHIRINISNYMIRSFIIGSAFAQNMTVDENFSPLRRTKKTFSDRKQQERKFALQGENRFKMTNEGAVRKLQ